MASIAPTPSSFGFLTTEDGTLVAHPDAELMLEPSSVLNSDLTLRLPEESNDEVTQIASAFNRFVGKMEAVLVDVRTSSENATNALPSY